MLPPSFLPISYLPVPTLGSYTTNHPMPQSI
jgi:hypothetical protein